MHLQLPAYLGGKVDLHPESHPSPSATNVVQINMKFSWGDIQLGLGKKEFCDLDFPKNTLLLAPNSRKRKKLWYQNWIIIALTNGKNTEYKHHWSTSRTRLCSSYPNKNPGKKSNQYWISVWNHMKKPFSNRKLSFSSLIKLLSLKLCVPASYIVHPQKSVLFVIFNPLLKCILKKQGSYFKEDQSAICTPKGRPWFFHISHYFSEEQLYKNFMYKLTMSVPSFQNDYTFYNNFWLMFWNCNAYFYAFTCKANQHPVSFFFSQHPLLYIYGCLRNQKGEHQATNQCSQHV